MSFAVLQNAFGLVAFVLIAWLLSENRRAVSVRLVAIGLALQLALAVMLLKLPMFQDVFLVLNRAMEVLEAGTRAGTSFVFGYLGGGALPFEEPYSGAAYIFSFRGLPVIWSRRPCRRSFITGRSFPCWSGRRKGPVQRKA